MIIQHIFTHMVHGRIKNTWEPASFTEPEQFTCCNKPINYLFFYMIEIEKKNVLSYAACLYLQ